MDSEHLQAISERDQLWASLRLLLPEIQKLAQGAFDGSERQQQLTQILARVVAAELGFRASESKA
jgi:hypothetical protein